MKALPLDKIQPLDLICLPHQLPPMCCSRWAVSQKNDKGREV